MSETWKRRTTYLPVMTFSSFSVAIVRWSCKALSVVVNETYCFKFLRTIVIGTLKINIVQKVIDTTLSHFTSILSIRLSLLLDTQAIVYYY